jgi:hypothetical protein
MAGSWIPTTTPNTHSSRISHGTSEPSPELLVGIREYATNSTDTDSVTRSSMKRTSFHACRREVGVDGFKCVIVRTLPRSRVRRPLRRTDRSQW